MIRQIEYRVVHHVHGRIRLQAPAIKKLSIKTLKKLSDLPIPDGIKNVHANPITGSIVIIYDPEKMNITEYLKKMMTDEELLAIIGMG